MGKVENNIDAEKKSELNKEQASKEQKTTEDKGGSDLSIESVEEQKEQRDKILNGLDLALHKLITEKKKSNSELALSNRGRVVKIKANEL